MATETHTLLLEAHMRSAANEAPDAAECLAFVLERFLFALEPRVATFDPNLLLRIQHAPFYTLNPPAARLNSFLTLHWHGLCQRSSSKDERSQEAYRLLYVWRNVSEALGFDGAGRAWSVEKEHELKDEAARQILVWLQAKLLPLRPVSADAS